MWRQLHPGETPQVGVSGPAQTDDIAITSVAQQCQVAVPAATLAADEVTVTVTSSRPGAAGDLSVFVNLNSADLSYQGPTIAVGQGQFTATDSEVQVSFVVLPTAGWPYLGVGAQATWADGSEQSVAITYVEIACRPWWWWTSWLIRVVVALEGAFAAVRRRTALHPGCLRDEGDLRDVRVAGEQE